VIWHRVWNAGSTDGPGLPDAALVPGVVPGPEQVEVRVRQDLTHVHQPVPLHTFKKYYNGDFRIFKSALYSALLYMPLLRFHCVGGCWDRTQAVATLALAVRISNHSAGSHPHSSKTHPLQLDLIHKKYCTYLCII
jgi:hypothetical protein